MKFLPSLDPKDRKLLVWSVSVAVVLAIATGILLPNSDNDDNQLPSSYLSGKHGALAAYETLERAGYNIERWERPLGELAAEAGPQTVVIFAEPFTRERDDMKAVRQILEKGGRVLATGSWGAFLLPGQNAAVGKPVLADRVQTRSAGARSAGGFRRGVDESQSHLAGGRSRDRVQYDCAGQPAVVEYDWGDGHVVWWASSTPLENGSLTRAQNLDLLLNSLGPRAGQAVLLGRVVARGDPLHVELCGRAGARHAGVRDSAAGDACAVQLQPAQRAGARAASAGARHAY